MKKTMFRSSPNIADLLHRLQDSSDDIATILYAAESGSRLWRIDSLDSDYDVRFIYLAPLNYHITAFGRNDVFEFVDEENKIDFVGLELRKAVGLMYKYNTNLLEWLRSDIVYIEPDHYVGELVGLANSWFSPRAAAWHYWNLAHNQHSRYLILSLKEVNYKKYLYVLRALMSAIWCMVHNELPPLDFNILRKHHDTYEEVCKPSEEYHLEIDRLLACKRAGELASGPRLAHIDDFIYKATGYFTRNIGEISGARMGKEEKAWLDRIYRDAVCEYFLD